MTDRKQQGRSCDALHRRVVVNPVWFSVSCLKVPLEEALLVRGGRVSRGLVHLSEEVLEIRRRRKRNWALSTTPLADRWFHRAGETESKHCDAAYPVLVLYSYLASAMVSLALRTFVCSRWWHVFIATVMMLYVPCRHRPGKRCKSSLDLLRQQIVASNVTKLTWYASSGSCISAHSTQAQPCCCPFASRAQQQSSICRPQLKPGCACIADCDFYAGHCMLSLIWIMSSYTGPRL